MNCASAVCLVSLNLASTVVRSLRRARARVELGLGRRAKCSEAGPCLITNDVEKTCPQE